MVCPFSDPEFTMPLNVPCPVCGMDGYGNGPDVCVDPIGTGSFERALKAHDGSKSHVMPEEHVDAYLRFTSGVYS